jgi:hypothetical protein
LRPDGSKCAAWFYVVTTVLVAFAFACPLFLLMRELRLRDD